MTDEIKMRRCLKCRQEKPIHEFQYTSSEKLKKMGDFVPQCHTHVFTRLNRCTFCGTGKGKVPQSRIYAVLLCRNE